LHQTVATLVEVQILGEPVFHYGSCGYQCNLRGHANRCSIHASTEFYFPDKQLNPGFRQGHL